MDMPLISIIIPVYNVEKYLNECIESVINQTYVNLEIILVDDGSPDNCPQICDNWMQKDSRIKAIHKKNGGLSDARNAGLDIVTGEYIFFIDSDDFIDSNTIQDLYKLIIKTDSDIACGSIYKYLNGETRPVFNSIINTERDVFSGIEQLNNMLNSDTDCAVWNKLFKREIIKGHRFIKGRYNEDIIFLFPLYARCNRIVYTNRRYYYYRDTAGSVTNKFSEKTVHALINLHEMVKMTSELGLPIHESIDNYNCRCHLELGYAIQRDNARERFPEESNEVKKYIISHLAYMVKSRYYNWRDMIHALIVLVRL